MRLNLGNLDKFKVEDAKEMLSTSNKNLWENVILEEIAKYAQENALTKDQAKQLERTKMLELLYFDLNGKNQYMSRTGDEYAVRAIQENKHRMYQINELYKQSSANIRQHVQNFGDQLNQRVAQMQQQTAKNKSTKKAA